MTVAWWQGARDRDRDAIPVCAGCGRPRPVELDGEAAIGVAIAEFGVTREELLGGARYHYLVRARAFVVWAMHALNEPAWSYPRIARLLRLKQHSSAINLHQKALVLRLRDPAFIAACARLSMRVEGLSEQKGDSHVQ